MFFQDAVLQELKDKLKEKNIKVEKLYEEIKAKKLKGNKLWFKNMMKSCGVGKSETIENVHLDIGSEA